MALVYRFASSPSVGSGDTTLDSLPTGGCQSLACRNGLAVPGNPIYLNHDPLSHRSITNHVNKCDHRGIRTQAKLSWTVSNLKEDTQVDAMSSEEEEIDGCNYEACTKAAVLDVFTTDLGCTPAEAKAYSRHITTDVKHVSWEDVDDVRTVECEAVIRSFEEGSKEGLTVRFQSHNRVRWSSVEHFSLMTTWLHAQAGKKFVFKTSMMDTSRYGLKEEISVENRKFSMSQASLKAIKRSIFKGFLPGKLTDISILNLMFAAVGAEVRGCVSSVALRDDWLEHYSRVLCGCPDPELDAGYETEDPMDRVREQREFEHDGEDDEDSNDGYTSDW